MVTTPKPTEARWSRHAWRLSGAVALSAAAIVTGQGLVTAANRQNPPQPPAGQQQAAPDPASCKGVLAQAGRVPGVLSGVPRYGSTYVLVVPRRLAEKVPSADAPGVKTLKVGVHTGTAAVDVARALGLTNLKEYALDPAAAAQPLHDVKDGTLDATILWAPLAGLGIIEFGLDGQVSVYTVDKPWPGPVPLGGGGPAGGSSDPCAAAVADELDISGVLPAELLVTVEIRDLLTRRAPAFDLAQARAGGEVFSQVCAKCHGNDAVADPKGLAPVDLRLSIARFSFPGFSYVLLNGRPERSMPPLRGTITDDQIAQMYQYLKARSLKLLPARTQ
jgi:mono/diheme cytochrome c family protein